MHYVGRCWRTPGVDYADFNLHGDIVPAPDGYDAVCRQCWPGGMVPEAVAEEPATGSSSSESEEAEED